MDHTFFLHPWTVVPGTEVTPGWRKCWQFLMELSKHGVSPGEAPIPKGRLASKKEGAGKIKWIKQHLLACLQMPSLCLSLASFLFCLVLVSLSSLVCLSEC